jgi:hypothetical protein
MQLFILPSRFSSIGSFTVPIWRPISTWFQVWFQFRQTSASFGSVRNGVFNFERVCISRQILCQLVKSVWNHQTEFQSINQAAVRWQPSWNAFPCPSLGFIIHFIFSHHSNTTQLPSQRNTMPSFIYWRFRIRLDQTTVSFNHSHFLFSKFEYHSTIYYVSNVKL